MKPELPAAWIDHDRAIRPYLWSHRILSWGKTAAGLVFVGMLLHQSRGAALQHLLKMSFPNAFVVWMAFFALLSVFWELASLPFGLMGHWIERRYQLSKQTYGSWLWDRVKGLAIGALLGFVVLAFVYGSLHLMRPYWWVACATFLILFSILLAQLAPVLLIPIFFKLKPLDPGPLKERLLALCTRFGIGVKEVYHLGMSDKTEKGNAAFTGLGRTKRILIGDTLYQKYPPEEVEAVFAHELGHQVHNDLLKGIGLSVVTVFVSFWAAQAWMARSLENWFDTPVETPFGFLVFVVALSVVQIPLGWLQLAFSRHREREADRFATEMIGVGDRLADALEKLTFQNRGPFRPNPILEFFQYSHPAPWRRILKLRR